MTPTTGSTNTPDGYVEQVNVGSGKVTDFASNKGKANGPATALGSGGFKRPLGLATQRTSVNSFLCDTGVGQVLR